MGIDIGSTDEALERKRALNRAACARCDERNPGRRKESRDRNKEANASRTAEWAKANRDLRNESCRRWREKNKEKTAAANLKFRSENPEYQANWFQENKERKLQQASDWRAGNRDQWNLYSHKRRIKISASRTVSADRPAQLLILQKHKCAACAANLKKTGYHVDHIKPLARGGLHEDKNLQLLCPPCNCRKSSKDPIDFMQSRGRLL